MLTTLNENIDSIQLKSKNTNESNINGNEGQLITQTVWDIGNLNSKGYRIDQLLTDIR